jgi:hypothetical protein
LALSQELNGVNTNSIEEIEEDLADIILGAWTAHRRLLARG